MLATYTMSICLTQNVFVQMTVRLYGHINRFFIYESNLLFNVRLNISALIMGYDKPGQAINLSGNLSCNTSFTVNLTVVVILWNNSQSVILI
jgi:hypothetical protein